MSAPDRRARLDRDHPALSARRQCALLGVGRSAVYRQPAAANDNELALMRRIDGLFTAWPFLGSRRITALLRAEGGVINRKRVQGLMRRMGIAALGPKPRTTQPALGHNPRSLGTTTPEAYVMDLSSRRHCERVRAKAKVRSAFTKPSHINVGTMTYWGKD